MKKKITIKNSIPTIPQPQEVLPQKIGIQVLKRLGPLYKKLKKEETKNKTALSKIRKLAREVLYALSEYRRANYVSIAAEMKWNKSILRKNKKNDLFNLTPTWARSSNRKEIYKILGGLVLEHCNPLSELADDILSSNKPIQKTLNNNLITCWITKKENKTLNERYKQHRYPITNGHREKESNWKKCYKLCGIKCKRSVK